jgi:hypothetical protein
LFEEFPERLWPADLEPFLHIQLAGANPVERQPRLLERWFDT